ncbi:MAG: very short patch repair endonuclease [Hyphomicrobium sp.]
MSRDKRSAVMARIKGYDTGPERQIAAMLAAAGLESERHSRDLPGRPDFVFREQKVAVFVDGDFWHGWRFSAWRHKLSEKWDSKIEGNRRRDDRNRRRLRRMGWKVLRVWEHQVKSDIEACVDRVTRTVDKSPHVAAAWRERAQPGKQHL